ncbi:MAG: hypothetical protein LIO87_05845 [Eubacterium sp.]|nr:hypothetical protein [Eubacterium sp.]
MDSYLSRGEHEEFRKTINAEFENFKNEDTRINKRLTAVEEATKQIQSLTLSVQELATNIKTMCETQKKESDRLAALENRDGEMWRKVSSYIITTVIGLIIGFIFTKLGIG